MEQVGRRLAVDDLKVRNLSCGRLSTRVGRLGVNTRLTLSLEVGSDEEFMLGQRPVIRR